MRILRPTLWRTCRVLANENRLDLLRELLAGKDRTVAALASRTGMSEQLASVHLRAIGARGLITARPNGRWLYYSATPNPLVDHAEILIDTLRKCCMAKMDNEQIIHCATAFTHQRRIEIVKGLHHKAMPFGELVFATQISAPALHRHLGKLLDREMLEHNGKLYRINTPANPLGETLLKLALTQEG